MALSFAALAYFNASSSSFVAFTPIGTVFVKGVLKLRSSQIHVDSATSGYKQTFASAFGSLIKSLGDASKGAITLTSIPISPRIFCISKTSSLHLKPCNDGPN